MSRDLLFKQSWIKCSFFQSPDVVVVVVVIIVAVVVVVVVIVVIVIVVVVIAGRGFFSCKDLKGL